MVIPTGFKCWFCDPNIILGFSCVRGNIRLVHKCFLETVASEGANIVILAVACVVWCVCWVGFLKDFPIVCLNVCCHARHTRIADFDIISINDGVKFVVEWKMFIYEAKKSFSDICFDLQVKWWIEPEDISPLTPVSTNWWCIFKFFTET